MKEEFPDIDLSKLPDKEEMPEIDLSGLPDKSNSSEEISLDNLPDKTIQTTPLDSFRNKISNLVQNPSSFLSPISTENVGTKNIGEIAKAGLELTQIPGELSSSAISNVAQELQDISIKHPNLYNRAVTSGVLGASTIPDEVVSLVKSTIKKGVEGLTGRAPGQYYDVYKKAGFPSWVSGILDLQNSIALDPTSIKQRVASKTLDIAIGSKKSLSNIFGSGTKAISHIKNVLSSREGEDFVLNRAKQAVKGLDEVYDGLSKEYDEIFDNIEVGNINSSRIYDTISELPESVISKVEKSTGLNVEDISTDSRKIQSMKKVLRKMVPPKVWSGRIFAQTDEQRAIKDVYKGLNNLLAEADQTGRLKPLNNRYRRFSIMRDELKDVLVDGRNQPKSEGLKTLFKKDNERNKQKFFDEFIDSYPQAQKIKDEMNAYMKIKIFKKIAEKAAVTGMALGAAGTVGGLIGHSIGRGARNQIR